MLEVFFLSFFALFSIGTNTHLKTSSVKTKPRMIDVLLPLKNKLKDKPKPEFLLPESSLNLFKLKEETIMLPKNSSKVWIELLISTTFLYSWMKSKPEADPLARCGAMNTLTWNTDLVRWT